jgi:arsenate reductase
LELAGIDTEGLRSKSWDEFAAPGAPHLDFIFTVCDNAAAEVCPLWPGQPITAHWGVADPAAVVGTSEEIERSFREAFTILERRISLLLALPLTTLDAMAIKRELEKIARTCVSRLPPLACMHECQFPSLACLRLALLR